MSALHRRRHSDGPRRVTHRLLPVDAVLLRRDRDEVVVRPGRRPLLGVVALVGGVVGGQRGRRRRQRRTGRERGTEVALERVVRREDGPPRTGD